MTNLKTDKAELESHMGDMGSWAKNTIHDAIAAHDLKAELEDLKQKVLALEGNMNCVGYHELKQAILDS